MKQSISIIGAGFSGLMTAVHLLQKKADITLNIISPNESFARGVAYKASSEHHLLNVPAGKMSCFPRQPSHFLDWLAEKEPYQHLERNLLASVFVPRNLYGEYLGQVWQETLRHTKANSLKIFNDEVVDIEELNDSCFRLFLKSGGSIQSDKIVLALGNEAPKNPEILGKDILQSGLYFQNPWAISSTKQVQDLQNILLIGNGLTMVDVVLALEENHFKGKIYAISPNGFQILPHRHNGIPYTQLLAEIPESLDLKVIEWFSLFRKHIRFVRQFGISAEPVIDSIRSLSPKIWQSLSLEDKRAFMRHLRHLWGVARHRLPVYVYDKIQEMQRKGSLEIIKGKVLAADLQKQEVQIIYWDKKEQKKHLIDVERIINCTGPNTDLRFSENKLLQNLFAKGMLEADDLYLGIKTDERGAIINKNKKYKNLYTLGSSLKGLFWESTAVPELRQQAEKLANILLTKITN